MGGGEERRRAESTMLRERIDKNLQTKVWEKVLEKEVQTKKNRQTCKQKYEQATHEVKSCLLKRCSIRMPVIWSTSSSASMT